MRASSFIFAAVAGVAVGFVGTPGANAMTSTSPSGVRVATEAMDTSALVHCRPFRHWHEWEHRRTFGCGGGGSVEIRRGHRVGVGIEERQRSRTSIHSRSSVTRGETSVRGSTSSKTGESTKSSTTTKSGGTSGATTGRGQGGEKSSTGGSSGGGMSGSGGTSGGQKQ
ncbi:MAG TPA: hypothetical protein VF913_02385 [Xanthobacteraceae bacterium]